MAPRNFDRPGVDFLPTPLAPDINDSLRIPEIETPNDEDLDVEPPVLEEGPADGLTLDAAIRLLLSTSRELRSRSFEIGKADADVLTAGLRENPLLFVDTQMVPYKPYSDKRPGGPTQYDVNLTIPLDWNGKRRYRIVYAASARRSVEALYQEVARQLIDRLYEAYVDLLVARDSTAHALAVLRGLERELQSAQSDREAGEATLADIEKARIRRDAARIGVGQAQAAESEARLQLASILELPHAQAESIRFRGSIDVAPPGMPAVDELIRTALATRPDLRAIQLGVATARSGVELAKAERFEDAFLFVQPLTHQDLSPYQVQSAQSFAVGLTVPLPIFNRNKGNIQKAVASAQQTQIDAEKAAYDVCNEVRRVHKRLLLTQQSIDEMSQGILPAARRELVDAQQRFAQGEADGNEVSEARSELNDLIRQYRDLLVQRRKAMLSLNTAVGVRVMP